MEKFSTIPGEIRNIILSQLDQKSLYNLSATNKKWYRTVHEGEIWKSLNLGSFGTGGSLKTVQQILNLEPKDPKAIINASELNPEDATKKRLLSAVKAILIGKDISDDKWDKALGEAALGGHTEIVKILLNKKPISLNGWLFALRKCSDDSLAEIAEILLKDHPKLFRSVAFIADELFKPAMENQQFKLAGVLIPYISFLCASKGLKSAVQSNNLEFAKVLIKSVEGIDGYEALIYAAKNCPKNVKFLLDSGLSSYDLSKAMQVAVDDGQLDIAEFLLSCGPVHNVYHEISVVKTARTGDFALLEAILQKAPILPGTWCEALKCAIGREDPMSARILLKYRPKIDYGKLQIQTTLDELVESLIAQNRFELAEILMGKDGQAENGQE